MLNTKKGIVSLDWKFRICNYITDVELDGVKGLQEETGTHFRRELKKLHKEIQKLSGDELLEDRGSGFTLEDHYSNLHDELRGIQAVRDDACIIMLYGVFERSLRRIFTSLKHFDAIPQSAQGRYLHHFKQQFDKLGVTIDQAPFNWKGIDELRVMRNCIVHSGWVDGETAKVLRRFNFKAKTQMEVPAGYFDEACKLVREFSGNVVTQFEKLSRKGKLKVAIKSPSPGSQPDDGAR